MTKTKRLFHHLYDETAESFAGGESYLSNKENRSNRVWKSGLLSISSSRKNNPCQLECLKLIYRRTKWIEHHVVVCHQHSGIQ